MDNERSIPSLVDGFKPGQRKVIFTCFKRNDKREVTVAQLAGSVGERSAYRHGEASLMSTIINLAQNFVGSNNINLLLPGGQFGTRHHGGKDAASPHYIFTKLSPLARLLFNVEDDATLRYLFDDNQRIEPEWYCPIIPMVLVNGAEGIGTEWSTRIHNYNPRDLVKNMKRMMEREEPTVMLPWFKDFTGVIQHLDAQREVCSGEIAVIDDNTVEITELPIRQWTQTYKENILIPMANGTDKTAPTIQEYKEYDTNTTVRFLVKMTDVQMTNAMNQGLHKFFKLQSTLSINSMVLFDHNNCIRRYNSVLDVLREFFTIRMERYGLRKDYMEGRLSAESLKLDNQARFILEKIDGTIILEKKAKKDIIVMLTKLGYDSDPVKMWKTAQMKAEKISLDNDEDQQTSDGEDQGDEDVVSGKQGKQSGPDYDYLVGMSMWNETKEKRDEILKKKGEKVTELAILRGKTPKDLWTEDLDQFVEELDRVEDQEKADNKLTGVVTKGEVDTKPSDLGQRIEPVIDQTLRDRSDKEMAAETRRIKRKEDLAAKALLGGHMNGDVVVQKEGSKPGTSKGGEKRKTSDSPKKPKGTKKKRLTLNLGESSVEGGDGSDISDWSDADGEDFGYQKRERSPRRSAGKKAKSKSPKIQRLITPLLIQRKRHHKALQKRKVMKSKAHEADYAKILALRAKEAK